ncbi:hypothetical protein LZ30DRAFT_336191 [Colletotrichum cereale]|nr:hypothetical protein LZ30DRAFT_336191 [Colletotrichum cereale]
MVVCFLIRLIHNDQVLSALDGSSFRRPLRLYMSILVLTFIIALIVYGGYYICNPAGAGSPLRESTLGQQLRYWVWANIDLMNPFRFIDVGCDNMRGKDLNDHLWTIPVEFRGSMLVVARLYAVAHVRSRQEVDPKAGGVRYCLLACLHGGN